MDASRSYAGAIDRDAVLELWLAARVPGLDDPWPSLDALGVELDRQVIGSERVRLWPDLHGRLIAAAILLDDCVLVWRARPGADGDDVEADILAWGQTATLQLTRGTGVRPALFVPVRSDDLRVTAQLARTGFRRDEWRTLRLERSLHVPLAAPQVPADVVLRPVLGEADRAAVAALHTSLFAVGEKTARSRAALMHAPGYRPGLDLVAVAADGTVVGYALGMCCVYGCERFAQMPGWIEFVGVARAWRGRGIGEALTLKLLHAMRAEGVAVALLTTGETNLAARRLFADCGFQTRHMINWFVRDLGAT